MPILPTERDPRFITTRRGGTLSDAQHRLLAEWANQCAEHVLPLFEQEQPGDTRPRDALAVSRAWIRGEVPMREAHRTAFVANAAGRGLPDPARFAALAAGQAVAVAHVPAHELGAAAYAIRAAAASASGDAEGARVLERDWQRDRLPEQIRELVLDDQVRRSAICWNVFDDVAPDTVRGRRSRGANDGLGAVRHQGLEPRTRWFGVSAPPEVVPGAGS